MKRKIIIAGGIIIAILVAFSAIRFFSGEDEWICEKGEWIKHGNPRAEKPFYGCGKDGDIVKGFESCSKAGYPVMESSPRTCSFNGQTFTEEIGQEQRDLMLPDNGNKEGKLPGICEDRCGDGICQEIVCMGSGCPCAESRNNCPKDCK